MKIGRLTAEIRFGALVITWKPRKPKPARPPATEFSSLNDD